MIYLASPYSADDPFEMEARYLAAAKALAWLLKERYWTFSPIVHCHELKKIVQLPGDHEFWLDYDCYILSRCSALYVLGIDGWERSKGVTMEREFARKNNIPAWLLLPFYQSYNTTPLK